jgi:protein-S-isoprenylcysteine O-methyltransferase Ste14
MVWSVILIIPLIVLSNAVTSWVYLFPDHFKLYFSQDSLIRFWFSLNLIILGLYLILCTRATFNFPALWLSLPCIALGAFLAIYAYSKLGLTRTFFGVELGLVDGGKSVDEFPFTLGHPQYKGASLFVLGLWLAFKHKLELTVVTGIWIVSFMVQLMIEAEPAIRTISRPASQ